MIVPEGAGPDLALRVRAAEAILDPEQRVEAVKVMTAGGLCEFPEQYARACAREALV